MKSEPRSKIRKPHDLLTGFDETVAKWIGERIPDSGPIGKSPYTAIGVLSGERLIAGAIYFDYYPEHKTIQIGLASSTPMWAQKSTIAALLAYPFVILGVNKVWAVMVESDAKAISCVERIGFKREAELGHHFGLNNHAVVLRLYRPDFFRKYSVKKG